MASTPGITAAARGGQHTPYRPGYQRLITPVSRANPFPRVDPYQPLIGLPSGSISGGLAAMIASTSSPVSRPDPRSRSAVARMARR